jgi:hypothetical protein
MGPSDFLIKAIYRMLRPLIRLLLRHGVPYRVFAEIGRHLYVDIARRDLRLDARQSTISRISTLTGISRKDIRKLDERPSPIESNERREYNRAGRVVGGWARDAQYRDADGHPKILPFEGLGSFSELAKRYGGDVPARTLLDELCRVGAVELLARDEVKLRHDTYLPQDFDEKLRIASTVVSDLLATLDHNLQPDVASKLPQRSLTYTNIPEEALTVLRQRSRDEIQQFLQHANAWFARHDRDVNQDLVGSGRARAGISVFYFEEPLDDEASDES